MKKEDFLAIGVPADRVREASDRWHKELRELVTVAADKDNKTAAMLRNAVSAILPTIKSVSGLRKILSAASTAYYIEDQERRRKRDTEEKRGEE